MSSHLRPNESSDHTKRAHSVSTQGSKSPSEDFSKQIKSEEHATRNRALSSHGSEEEGQEFDPKKYGVPSENASDASGSFNFDIQGVDSKVVANTLAYDDFVDDTQTGSPVGSGVFTEQPYLHPIAQSEIIDLPIPRLEEPSFSDYTELRNDRSRLKDLDMRMEDVLRKASKTSYCDAHQRYDYNEGRVISLCLTNKIEEKEKTTSQCKDLLSCLEFSKIIKNRGRLEDIADPMMHTLCSLDQSMEAGISEMDRRTFNKTYVAQYNAHKSRQEEQERWNKYSTSDRCRIDEENVEKYETDQAQSTEVQQTQQPSSASNVVSTINPSQLFM
ncbi:uncharacterized protein IL334_001764 [Kwoniella shivajii]|uniref:Uncharacterized protein n=1 Tax=Kwoniella shivajii TaxID=564305 RepID=A0ABZ1CTG9_9TREE|nr:hypothetical protein IL334_001764 [Kwoniella shivajii]